MQQASAHAFFHQAVSTNVQAYSAAPKAYDFALAPNSWAGGNGFQTNAQGDIVGAIYASGAAVKINDTFKVVRASDLSLWFADSNEAFHPLD